MARFCCSLSLPKQVQNAAVHIAQTAGALDLVGGRSPLSLAAAAIYMASQVNVQFGSSESDVLWNVQFECTVSPIIGRDRDRWRNHERFTSLNIEHTCFGINGISYTVYGNILYYRSSSVKGVYLKIWDIQTYCSGGDAVESGLSWMNRVNSQSFNQNILRSINKRSPIIKRKRGV